MLVAATPAMSDLPVTIVSMSDTPADPELIAELEELSGFPAEEDHIPPDALDALAKLVNAVEELEVAMMDDNIDGTVEDRVRLLAYINSLNWQNGKLTAVARWIEEALYADMDGPVEVDGEVWAPKRVPRRSGFEHDELRRAIMRWARRDRLDEATGELSTPEPHEVIENIWVLVSPATGRTAKFRDADIDLDEYARTDWDSRVKKIDPNTIRPEDR